MFRKRFEQLMSEVPPSIPLNDKDGKNSKASIDADAKSSTIREDLGVSSEKSETKKSSNPADSLTSFYTTFMIGDIVKVRQGYMMYEGVVVEVSSTTLDVDFGDDIETVPLENCCLVMNGLDYEIGDYVSACPAGDLYFNGKIVSINTNGTFDILFDGDDPEDVERNIRPDKLRKIRTGRQLVLNRWQKAKNLITMSLAWASVNQGNETSFEAEGKFSSESKEGETKGSKGEKDDS